MTKSEVELKDWLLHGPIRSTISPSAFHSLSIPIFYLSNRGSRAAAVGASHPAAGAGRDMAGVHRRGYSRAYGAMVLVLASMQWAGLRGAAAFQLLQHARGSLQQRRQQAVRARGLLRGMRLDAPTACTQTP